MFPILSILDPIGKILDRVLPDKAANDAAKAQLLQLQLSGELANATAQLGVDQAEAANPNWFVSSWRPFVGWICGTAFAYAFIVQPFMQFALVAFHSNFDPAKLPVLNSSTLQDVLFGMLGLGAMRSWDKQSGNGNGH